MEKENTPEFKLLREFETAITNEYNSRVPAINNQISEISKGIDLIEDSLKDDDSIQKLEKLIYIDNAILESLEKHYLPYRKNIANEIEKLERLHKNGFLQYHKSETRRFETTLTGDERLELCNKIIAEASSIKPNYDKTFIGCIDVPTLSYLLGGNKPEKIVKIKMTTHQKVYDLLLSISKHTFNDKICVPNFVKNIICPEVLLNRDGNIIKKLNEKVPVR